MADEIRGMQTAKAQRLKSEGHSSRSSTEHPSRHERLDSPAPKGTSSSAALADSSNSQTPTPIDYVYLKNVLLQFLEQKDKKHQMQLIPVLGMLLHFDRYVIGSPLSPSRCPALTSFAERMSRNGCLPLSPSNNHMDRLHHRLHML